MTNTFSFRLSYLVISALLLISTPFLVFSQNGIQESGVAPLPKDALGYFALGEDQRAKENYYLAIEAYLGALERNATFGDAYFGLAESYYALGEYDQALSFVNKTKPFKKNNSQLLNLEAFIHTSLGSYSIAEKLFAQVRAAKPNDTDARFGQALIGIAQAKLSEARQILDEARRLSPQDVRYLLSLALLAQYQGRQKDAEQLLNTALQIKGQEARTHFVAAQIAMASWDLPASIAHLKISLEIKPDYPNAQFLLARAYYATGSYNQSIEILRNAIKKDRKLYSAWYLLGLAQAASAKYTEAIFSLKTAANLRPEDEIIRLALEDVVMKTTNAEDESRQTYSDWHYEKGKALEEKNFHSLALFEYRRALKIYPYSKKARLTYATLLLTRGYPVKYLGELQFLRDNNLADVSITDAIEGFDALLANSISRNWNVKEDFLPKRPYKIAVMRLDIPSKNTTVQFDDTMLQYFKDILSAYATIIPVPNLVNDYSQAFRVAREGQADYFILYSASESGVDIQISLDVRVGRTGSPAIRLASFRSGNDRIKLASSKAVDNLFGVLPVKGTVQKRSQDTLLLDVGKSEGLVVGQKLDIIQSALLSTAVDGMLLSYPKEAKIGEITLTRVGEEVSEGILKKIGFYDKIQTGDSIIKQPATTTANTAKSPLSTPAQGVELPDRRLFFTIKELR